MTEFRAGISAGSSPRRHHRRPRRQPLVHRVQSGGPGGKPHRAHHAQRGRDRVLGGDQPGKRPRRHHRRPGRQPLVHRVRRQPHRAHHPLGRRRRVPADRRHPDHSPSRHALGRRPGALPVRRGAGMPRDAEPATRPAGAIRSARPGASSEGRARAACRGGLPAAGGGPAPAEGPPARGGLGPPRPERAQHGRVRPARRGSQDPCAHLEQDGEALGSPHGDGAGRTRRRVVPRPSTESMLTCPPIRAARSCTAASPRWPSSMRRMS